MKQLFAAFLAIVYLAAFSCTLLFTTQACAIYAEAAGSDESVVKSNRCADFAYPCLHTTHDPAKVAQHHKNSNAAGGNSIALFKSIQHAQAANKIASQPQVLKNYHAAPFYTIPPLYIKHCILLI